MAKLFESKGYKTVMGYVYGWGATAVIIGALFKIMHFPGAGPVLTVGMLVEALIFFLSVFEPAPEHYDWARVFPELAGAHGGEPAAVKRGAAQAGGNAPVSLAGLDGADVSRLKEGISKFVTSAESFSEASVNVPDFTRKINNAAASFERLGEKGQKAGELLEASIGSFSDGYNEIHQMLKASSGQLTTQIKANCEKLASTMGESSEGFGALNRIMEEQLLQVKTQAENYTQQIAGVNKNISALNALYELQVNETKDCLESFRGMQSDLGEMLENVSLGLDSTKLFKQEARQLANNVASLNTVYGNMLSMIDNN